MPNKRSMGRIKIARASNTTLSTLTDVLPAGNPIYNKTSNYLYIGDGTTQVKNLNPLTSNKIADSSSSVNVSDTISTSSHPNDPYVSVKGKDLYVENNVEVAVGKTIYTDSIVSSDSTIQDRVVQGKINNAVNADNASNADNADNTEKIKDWGAQSTSYIKLAVVNSIPASPSSDTLYLIQL